MSSSSETPIDHSRLSAALAQLEVGEHPFLQQAAVVSYAAKIAEHPEIPTYEQLFAPAGLFDADPETLGNCLIPALAAARALDEAARAPTRSETLTLAAQRTAHVFAGDLHVDGNLSFAGRLVVLGDLTVSGTLEANGDFATLWVTGSITTKGIKADDWCNSVYAHGSIDAQDLVVTSQTIAAGGGITTRLLLEYDGFRGIHGELKATKHIRAEELLEQIESPGSELRRLLVATLFKPSSELDAEHALAANAFEALRRGRSIFGTRRPA
jgi:cytoskeletal protein CcmA (bactofilin family)